MAGMKVHLVFGPQTRVVPVRVAGGRINEAIISKQIKPGERLLGVIGHRQGDLTPAMANRILQGRVDIKFAAAPELAISEMIDIPGMPGKRIMVGEVTRKFFGEVMEGYEIKGHNAGELRAILTDPAQENKPLTYVSLLDAREFAARISNSTGRKFRVQTEDEWLAARGKLTGDNWTWTETKYSDSSFVLRRLGDDYRGSHDPERRYLNRAVRLVEDK